MLNVECMLKKCKTVYGILYYLASDISCHFVFFLSCRNINFTLMSHGPGTRNPELRTVVHVPHTVQSGNSHSASSKCIRALIWVCSACTHATAEYATADAQQQCNGKERGWAECLFAFMHSWDAKFEQNLCGMGNISLIGMCHWMCVFWANHAKFRHEHFWQRRLLLVCDEFNRHRCVFWTYSLLKLLMTNTKCVGLTQPAVQTATAATHKTQFDSKHQCGYRSIQATLMNLDRIT